jgi:hypothetical protein
MGFTVETRPGPAVAIRAGKNDRTPVFVDVAALTAKKGSERAKFLKEEADRGSLTDKVGKPLAAATDQAGIIAALRPIVDERASPGGHIAPPGTPLLQPTDERRRTGSHYTPRSLTAPIVQHALEPAFARLEPGAKPEAVLDLKVCDPAMGSGAFLVEACRALGERLVQAWTRWPETRPTIPLDEDEHLHARRLVAQRCLYGVDKNPLATDLAKLSLWLVTLARDHEFTFLDHALKSGDSLVGLNKVQIVAAHWDTSKPGLPLFRQLVKDRVAEAMKGRAEIQGAPDDITRAVQEQRHRSLEAQLKEIRLMGDAVIAAFFAADKPKEREKKRAEVESWLGGSPVAWGKLAAMAATLKQEQHPLPPFHWEIEFPEVFARANGGFDAIVGNPPFLGGKKISSEFGDGYRDWLPTIHEATHGNGDLVAHFFRRSFALLRSGGLFGLIATNTVGQGDTRSSGLTQILVRGGTITRAVRRLKWPGDAAVTVSVVHVGKDVITNVFLDGRLVRRISAYVVEGDLDTSPAPLAENSGKAFQGSIVLGMGFTFDDQAAAKGAASSLSDMKLLIMKDERNGERIFPYIGGDEINTDPRQQHFRFIIDYAEMTEGEARSRWPDLIDILEKFVRPERQKQKREDLRKRWWQFAYRKKGLYRAIANLPRVLAISRVSSHLAFCFLPTRMIYSIDCIVFAMSEDANFAVMQSRLHELWVRFLASTLEDRLRYTPSDCFENFPFPSRGGSFDQLEATGRAYNDHRAALMVSRNEGMTKTYNHFHHDQGEVAEDIQRLRELHAAMDRAVLEAYASGASSGSTTLSRRLR